MAGAAAAAAEGLFRCVFEGCISTPDTDIERRPYHKNCSCALHRSSSSSSSKTTTKNSNCSSKSNKKLSYPMRRSWSEGCLALSNLNSNSSANNSNCSSSCSSPVAAAIPPAGLSFGGGKPPGLFRVESLDCMSRLADYNY